MTTDKLHQRIKELEGALIGIIEHWDHDCEGFVCGSIIRSAESVLHAKPEESKSKCNFETTGECFCAYDRPMEHHTGNPPAVEHSASEVYIPPKKTRRLTAWAFKDPHDSHYYISAGLYEDRRDADSRLGNVVELQNAPFIEVSE